MDQIPYLNFIDIYSSYVWAGGGGSEFTTGSEEEKMTIWLTGNIKEKDL